MNDREAGKRCVFCNSTTDVEWRIKGTGVPVCRRCGATRVRFLVRAVSEAAGRKAGK